MGEGGASEQNGRQPRRRFVLRSSRWATHNVPQAMQWYDAPDSPTNHFQSRHCTGVVEYANSLASMYSYTNCKQAVHALMGTKTAALSIVRGFVTTTVAPVVRATTGSKAPKLTARLRAPTIRGRHRSGRSPLLPAPPAPLRSGRTYGAGRTRGRERGAEAWPPTAQTRVMAVARREQAESVVSTYFLARCSCCFGEKAAVRRR